MGRAESERRVLKRKTEMRMRMREANRRRKEQEHRDYLWVREMHYADGEDVDYIQKQTGLHRKTILRYLGPVWIPDPEEAEIEV